MTVEPVPDWVRPVGGFMAGDLDQLPGLPPHTELIDGGLVFMSPHRRFHDEMIFLLKAGLRSSAPPDVYVAAQMSIVLSERQRPEPDVCVVGAHALGDGEETWYPAAAVLLAVEVVSPESQVRDREHKPQLYARAGITHFWRVEGNTHRPVVYVYERDPATSAYALTGIHHDRLTLTVPFPIDIDLSAAADGRHR